MTRPRGPVLGIDVGGTKIAAGWWDGRLLGWTEAPTPRDAAPREIARLALELAPDAPGGGPRGVGVAFPGDLEPGTARVRTAPNVPSFVGASVVEVFGQAADTMWKRRPPILALNDTCAALLAEQAEGAGRGCSRPAYVTVSTGVGGAAATEDSVRNLEPGLSLRPDAHRPDACLEDLAGGAGLARRAREELAAAVDGARCREWTRRWLPGRRLEDLEAADLAAAAAGGDPWADGLLADSARWVARGLRLLRQAGHGRDRMILGGSIALKTPRYIDRVREELGGSSGLGGSPPEAAGGSGTWLVAAELGDERGVLGAALALFDGRTIT